MRPRLTLLACAIAFTLARLTLDLYLPDCTVVEATLILPCCRIAWSSDLIVRHRVVYYDVGCSDDDARKFRIEWNEHCCARQRLVSSVAHERRRARNRHRRRLARFFRATGGGRARFTTERRADPLNPSEVQTVHVRRIERFPVRHDMTEPGVNGGGSAVGAKYSRRS